MGGETRKAAGRARIGQSINMLSLDPHLRYCELDLEHADVDR
jgi:hypothetical protein